MSKLLPQLGRRGATAMEFAIIGPVFIMLVLGMLEVAFLYVAQWDLDEATYGAARSLQTDPTTRASATTQVGFNGLFFCNKTVFIACSRVTIALSPAPSGYKLASQQPTPPGINVGGQSSLMMLHTYYQTGLPTWPVNIATLVSAQAYQNEN